MDRKRMKKLISILTVVAIFSMSFASAFSVSAEGELYTISADDVTEAILFDNSEEEPKTTLYDADSYSVSATQGEGTVNVTIAAENVVKHENAAHTPGYWVGFAVKAPDEATKAMGVFGGEAYTEGVAVINENGDEGIAFYVNAGELNPKTEATLTWFNGESEISAEATFVIDIENVILDVEYAVEGMINEAIIADKDNQERTVYDDTSYDVTYTNGVVDIDIEKLELHKNGEDSEGFWTGFSIEAPVDATFAKYSFGETTDGYTPVVDIDGISGDKMGLAFYTDAANPKTSVKLQWFEGAVDGENNALSNPIELTMNLDGVEYYKVDAENDVTETILFDNSAEPQTTLYDADSYSVGATQGESAVNVTIAAENVVKHENAAHTPGYWVGFAVKAPDGATKATGIFGGEAYTEGVTVINENGDEGIAFYVNAGAENPKTTATLQWLAENGETLSAVTTFEIVLNVTLAVNDYTPEVVEANIADYNEERAVYDTDSYTAEYDAATGIVTIAMTGLKEHTREGNVEGYWTGFAVEAPEGATKFKYAFGSDKETLAWEAGLHALEDINGEGKMGVAFITDANAEAPKKFVKLQWFGNDNNAVTEVVEFEMNLDGVKLNWIKADEVSAATARSGEVTPEVAVTQNDDVINVTLTAENVKKHFNEDTTPAEGYWVGFAVEAPSADAQMKYAFGATDELTLGDVTEELETISENKKGIAFYTNAGAATPKLYAMLQWFANDGVTPLSAPTKFVVDISGVTFAGLDYIAAEDVKEAKIVDQSNTSVNPYGTYSAIGTANENGVITVDIDMTDLKSHESIGQGAGHWTGFAIAAPAEATHMKVVFDTEANIDWNNASYSTTEPSVVADEDGVAFYTNANASEPKTVAMLQWYNGSEPISNVTTIKMDLSGVSLYVAPQPPRGGSGSSNYYTVKFDSNGGSTVASVKVKKEAAISAPATPVKNGFVFDGWYTDKELTQKYDFAATVTKSFTLYAKWAEVQAAPLKFTDIKSDAWYYDVVKTIVEKGLMNGISDTQFAPELEVTRAMFVTILYRAAGEPQVAATTSFADVSADAYYAKAVAWANANGIVNGITESEFAPDNNITREQMAAILYRYAKNETVAGEITYTDKAAISDYALDAINWAYAAGIMTGNEDGSFAPLRNSSRAEAAAVFVRLLG